MQRYRCGKMYGLNLAFARQVGRILRGTLGPEFLEAQLTAMRQLD